MEELAKDIKIISPQPGFQEKFVQSNVDVVIGGGSMNCGKSYAAILMLAEPCLDPNFRAVFLRRNLAETKVGGGLLQDMKSAYKGIVTVKESDNPRVTFPSGAFCDLTHISDERRDKLLERIKGWQYDLIYLDEGTSYEWTTFLTLFSRNRGKGKWTGKMRMTTNPKKTHWLRKFLDWYIGADGFIRKDRDGVVRYFYINGKRVEDVVWGDSKEEVYQLCRQSIDRQLRKLGSEFTYKDLIKSFCFYLGNISENKASIGSNKGYVGSVAAMGGESAMANLEGNWNVDPDSDEYIPIPFDVSREVFSNDPKVNGDKWITVDLADIGKDNLVAIVWDGFHMIDIMIVQRSTPRMNADMILDLARDHDIADCNIIYDGINAAYMYDYIPDAMPFISGKQPVGVEGRSASTLKDECYLRLVRVLKERNMSCSESVASRRYLHQKNTSEVYFENEFTEECSVVRFNKLPSGKMRLMSKKDMNAMLGKGRSMDVLDPCAMRMYPVLQFVPGEELVRTAKYDSPKESFVDGNTSNIYDDRTWA